MATTAAKRTRDYLVIIAFSLIAGLTSMIVCAREREHVSELTDAEQLQKDLRIASLAALAFQNDHGRLPYSLKELRALQSEHYLPNEFALKGVMYFRNDGGRPRLSWRDDAGRSAAYCRLDAALRGTC